MATRPDEFNKAMHRLIDRCNGFFRKGSSRSECVGFYVDGEQLGLVRKEIAKQLAKFPEVFDFVPQSSGEDKRIMGVHLSQSLVAMTPDERTAAVQGVMESLRDRGEIKCLQGWKNEKYIVSKSFSSKPLFHVERAAAPLLGVVTYGAHINGYTYDKDGQMLMWIGKRMQTKSTFPGLYDNMTAGGLGDGLGVMECAKKELEEEASVPDELMSKLKYTGMISYCYEDERGVMPEVEFTFDLELPRDFTPVNADGEVEKFKLVPITEMKEMISQDIWKPNCALVIFDFLIRHGIVNPDTDADYCYFLEQIHTPIQTFFAPNNVL